VGAGSYYSAVIGHSRRSGRVVYQGRNLPEARTSTWLPWVDVRAAMAGASTAIRRHLVNPATASQDAWLDALAGRVIRPAGGSMPQIGRSARRRDSGDAGSQRDVDGEVSPVAIYSASACATDC
jgi:hypothetical protein